MIRETGVFKTLAECNAAKKGITDFLNIGDSMDDDFFDYFLGVLPPACMSKTCLQIGEPYDHTGDGKPTFMTLVKQGPVWIYAGCIPTPETETCLYRE
jgi:hypothetical protein